MTTKEQIEVMKACLDGKKIQYKPKNSLDIWKNTNDPKWNWQFGDYRIQPEDEEPQKMTARQLAEWCAKGFGQVKSSAMPHQRGTVVSYLEYEENLPVSDSVAIRSWGSEEWIVPTVDIYKRDCEGEKQ